MLTVTDYVTIVVYSGLLILMGVLLAKKAAGGIEEYFLGGRKLPWYFLGCSGMASWFDVTGTMVITSFLFMIGPQALYIGFRGDAVLVLIFLLCFTGKWHRRSGVMTGAEWMHLRFGTGRDADAARLLTAIVNILPVIGLIAYLMKGTGLFLSMFFPFPPELCAGVLIFIAVIYTMMSGFYGVVISDVIQSVLIFVSALILGVMAFNMIDGTATIDALAQSVNGISGWSDSAPKMNVEFPATAEGSDYDKYRFLGLAMAFFLFQSTIFGLSSGADPKYFASKSDRDVGKLNLLIGGMIAIRWPMMIGLAVLGLFLVDDMFEDKATIAEASQLVHTYYDGNYIDEETGEFQEWKSDWHSVTTKIISHPDEADPTLIASLEELLGKEDWKKKLPLVAYSGVTDPERILPAVILNYAPVGLLGVILVTALAATMSTFDSTLNAASSFVVRDIYQRWIHPNASEKQLIRIAWITTAVVASIGFFAGLNFDSINNVWEWVLLSLMTGLFVPNFLRLYWWRMNGWGVAFGMAFGAIAAISQKTFLAGMFVDAPYYAGFFYVGAIAFTGTIVGCLLTKPTDMKTLVHFYKKTRPFGLWGPVRKYLKDEQIEYIDSENKRDLVAVPFVFIYQVLLFLIPMQIIIHNFVSLTWSVPLFVVGCLGMYFIWWKNQRPDRDMASEPDLLEN
ncbi:MAG: sodium:solute symporter [Verrucomicrobiota bacterium]